jgi:hypothetical protein
MNVTHKIKVEEKERKWPLPLNYFSSFCEANKWALAYSDGNISYWERLTRGKRGKWFLPRVADPDPH